MQDLNNLELSKTFVVFAWDNVLKDDSYGNIIVAVPAGASADEEELQAWKLIQAQNKEENLFAWTAFLAGSDGENNLDKVPDVRSDEHDKLCNHDFDKYGIPNSAIRPRRLTAAECFFNRGSS